MRDFLIKNLTPNLIEHCQSSLNTITLFSGSTFKLTMRSVSWWHGHSDIGSFVITRRHNDINFKVWGNLVLKSVQNDDSVVFELTEKDLSE